MVKAISEEIRLIEPKIEDYDFYYDLKSEKTNIFWSGHTQKPNYETFKVWYIENVINKSIIFKFIDWKNKHVGALYFKIYNNICTYLGLAISEKYQGLGISKIAVLAFINHIKEVYVDCETIKFYIREDHYQSISIHKKLGCIQSGEYEYKFLESENKEIKMIEWILRIK